MTTRLESQPLFPLPRAYGERLLRGERGKLHAIMWGLLALAMLLYPVYEPISPWIGAGLFFSGCVLIQFTLVLKHRVAYLELMLLHYAVSFFVTSWALQYLEGQTGRAIRGDAYSTYLAYALPCCLGVYAGIAIAIRGLASRPFADAAGQPPPWARYSIAMLVVGIACYFAWQSVPTTSGTAYPLLLVADLRWVGAFTVLLSGRRGAWIGVCVVLMVELLAAIRSSMFIGLILWAGCAFVVAAYRYQWRKRAVVGLLASVACLLVLQSVKAQYRRSLIQGADAEGTSAPIVSERTSSFLTLFWDCLGNPATLLQPKRLATVVSRFDQGATLDRVMHRVPILEPFAGGATILNDLIAVALPRVLVPDKAMAGGRELYMKYTGLSLDRRTSISISTVAEMYVNFGPYLGVVAMFLYGLGIGGLYRCLARRALDHPAWWAWGPFVALGAIKADEDFMNVANGIIKSLLVIGLIVWFTNAARKDRRSERV